MDNGNLIITKSRDTFNPSKDDDDFNISVNIKNNAAGDKYKFVVKKGEITSLPKNLGTTTLKNLLMKLLLKMTLRLAIQKLLVRILQLTI